MTLIEKQQLGLDKLNAKFRAYKDDVVHHAGWVHAEAANEKTKQEFLLALSELSSLSVEHESNAKYLCDLNIRKGCGIDDIDALLHSADIPANHSNAN